MKKNVKETILTMFNLRENTGLHITTNHTGKMAGMYSLSTCCACNEHCKAYAKDPNKVCNHCYADTMMKMYKSMKNLLINNTEILTTVILDKNKLPLINALYFGFYTIHNIDLLSRICKFFY